MLKGHVFNLQTFTSEAFALFIDKFLNGRCGIAKGCELSVANTSVTIGDGYFVIRGRFLQIISGVTISDLTTDGYYRLVCEIDLSKTNTVDALNQATIKTLYGASDYPTLTQQDITGSGTVYQYEFARFQVSDGMISYFQPTRTTVDFETIYDEIEAESEDLLEEIREALADVLDGSAYLLKSAVDPNSLINRGEIAADTDIRLLTEPGIYICHHPSIAKGYPTTSEGVLEIISTDIESDHVIQRYSVAESNERYERHVSEELGNWTKIIVKNDFAVLTGTITLTNGNGSKTFDYPQGFTQSNCVPIAGGTKYSTSLNRIAFGSVQSSLYTGVYLNSSNIALNVDPYQSGAGPSGTFDCKVVLMKIS